ncbi:NF-kappa-B inhibitor cactus [Anopheles bellator]|uniref:NF-kappa-B inhibitor cactus n=1 Tax=Anopheles bellator TaxID=139047 RepID=UPI0026485B8E|nr:NF-kappa-B inhibitor cactus [Anopheles bellator]
MHSSRGPAMNTVSIGTDSSSGQPLAGKKDYCDSANTDSGFLSGHNLHTSESLYSTESLPPQSGANPSGASVATAPSSAIDEKEAAADEQDSGMLPDAEPSSHECDIMDICQRLDRLMKRDGLPWYQQNEMGDTSLHLAVYEENDELVRKLTASVPRQFLNIQNDAGRTALHWAVLLDQPRTVRRLVTAGACLTTRDPYGNTALHLACGQANVRCAKELLAPPSAVEMQENNLVVVKIPQDLEQWNYDGKTCVHLAAEVGSIPVLRCLINAGANINAREGKAGRCPLHISIDRGNEELANFLLDECPRVSLELETYAGLTAYQLAVLQNKRVLAEGLAMRGASNVSPPESDIESDSEDELMISNYDGTNVFSATFPGMSTINVS